VINLSACLKRYIITEITPSRKSPEGINHKKKRKLVQCKLRLTVEGRPLRWVTLTCGFILFLLPSRKMLEGNNI
jgi:hypothetical protein